MAFQIADRVKETTTTTGTGTLSLGGAVSQFQTFVAGIGNGNETYYSIEDPTGTDWEVGIGTVTDAATDTLSRDTVISSSNGGSLVNFGAGEKVVFSTQPASKTFILSSDNTAVISNINASTLTAGTLADARLSANVTLNNASTISTGTLSQDRLANSSITINGTGVALGGSINVGDITGVTAGDGLTGGGTTGAVTLNVGAGTGIDVTADTVAVDVSDFMTNGSNNRVLTATGTDAMNAEANMTFDGSTLAVTGGASFTANVSLGDLDHILMGATGEYQIYHDHANGVSNIKDVDVGGTINIEAENITLTGPVTATANVSLGDNDYLRLGAGNDLQIYHDGSHSYIAENGAGNLYLYGGNIILKNPAGTETKAVFNTNGSVDLYYDAVKKFETTSGGIDVTGTVTFDGGTTSADLNFGDSDKAVFGADSDLQIYHSGADNESYIKEAGSGNLFIGGDTNIVFTNSAFTETKALFATNGSVDLYYDNVKKFETTSTGVDVTGLLETTTLQTTSNVGVGTVPGATSANGQTIKGIVSGVNNGNGVYTALQILNRVENSTTTNGMTIDFDHKVSGATTIPLGRVAGFPESATAGHLRFYASTSSALTEIMRLDNAGIDVTGAITATGDITAFYTSDETLKTNIANIENPMDKVAQLNGVSYNWTEEAQAKYDHLGEEKEVGVIAQQVEKVLPEMVGTRDDGTKAVRYERMCALLIECVKDLQNQVNELKGTK